MCVAEFIKRAKRLNFDCLVPARVQPLDVKYNAVSESFGAVLHDISKDGISLMVTQDPTTDFVNVVTILPLGDKLDCVVKVIHYSAETMRMGGRFVNAPTVDIVQ